MHTPTYGNATATATSRTLIVVDPSDLFAYRRNSLLCDRRKALPNGERSRASTVCGAGTLLAENRGVHVHPSNLQRLRSRRRVGGRHTAGFTLLELMVVVIMIGVLAALGVPSIAAQMRDRRTNQAAHEVALLYRQARSLAMGRGALWRPA